jgi:hypothetical protein
MNSENSVLLNRDSNIKVKEINIDNGDIFGYGKDKIEDKDYVGV